MNPAKRLSPPFRALVVALVAITTLAIGIQAASGARDLKVLGKKSPAPPAACPDTSNEQGNPFYKQCQVQGQVTVFQRTIQGKEGFYKARSDGKLVAWSLSLGKPTQDEQETLLEYGKTDEFPDSATAGVAVLKSVGEKKFKLKAKSPILEVDRFFGEDTVITLDQPLPMKQGEIAAMTTATYLPFLGIKEPGENAPLQGEHTYVASRKAEDCKIPQRIKDKDENNDGDELRKWYFNHTSPQRKVGSERAYECLYTGQRLLYKAYFVPNPGN